MAAPVFSNPALSDIGNGLGYIYVTNPIAISGAPTAGEIYTVLPNDADGVRTSKVLGLQASALATNRVATGIITIDAPTGVGSITNIKVSTMPIINTGSPITYTGATTDADLAQKIVDGINAYSPGSSEDTFSAVRIDNVVYISTSVSGVSKYNNKSTTITSTGFFTYTEDQIVSGGSTSDESFDDSFGYQFFLDADYASGGCCSGAGTATINDLSKALEITPFIVNIGLQSAIPRVNIQLADDSIVYDRKGALTLVKLTGEGGANDSLDTIITKNPSDGDRIVLYSLTNTITINSGSSNIILKTSTYDVITTDSIELMYNTSTNIWYELSRSNQVIGSIADYRAAGYGMFSSEGYNTATVAATGTVNFTPNVSSKYQKLTGAATLTGNVVYGFAGTPVNGDEFFLEYDAAVTRVAFTLTIFGITVTADQALNGGLIFYARYVSGGWQAQVYPNLNSGGTYTFQAATEFYKDNSVTVAKVSSTLKTEVIVLPISWDTNRTGDHKIILPYPCTVSQIDIYADDLIEATDDADVNFKNNAGLSMGTQTFTAGDLIGTGLSITPSANNIFTAGQVLTATTTKTTKGGNAKVSLTIVKS